MFLGFYCTNWYYDSAILGDTPLYTMIISSVIGVWISHICTRVFYQRWRKIRYLLIFVLFTLLVNLISVTGFENILFIHDFILCVSFVVDGFNREFKTS